MDISVTVLLAVSKYTTVFHHLSTIVKELFHELQVGALSHMSIYVPNYDKSNGYCMCVHTKMSGHIRQTYVFCYSGVYHIFHFSEF